MIKIEELTKKDISRPVLYRSKGRETEEKGILKSWNSKYIFVIYKSSSTAAASLPEDLEFEKPSYRPSKTKNKLTKKETERMAIVNIKRKDVDKFALTKETGWTAVEVVSVSKPRASAKESCQVYDVVLRILDGPDTDKEINDYLNDHPQGGTQRIAEFVASGEGYGTMDELFKDSPNIEVDPEKTAGKQLLAKVVHGTYQGNLRNKIDGYLPLSSPSAREVTDEDVPF